MQAIDVDSVCRIILQARAYDVDMPLDANAVEDELPSADGAPYDMQAGETSAAREAAAGQAIREFIAGMNVDQRAELVALAWVGRGSYTREEWPEALRLARDEHAEDAARYLLELPLVADYLEDGLAAFDRRCGE